MNITEAKNKIQETINKTEAILNPEKENKTIIPSISKVNNSDLKIGIVMSGGGALGFAHIGVLKALKDIGITPTFFAGSSMGALVGVFAAAGMEPEDMKKMVFSERIYKPITLITVPSFGKEPFGFSSHKRVQEILDKYIPYDNFESLPYYLSVCATNLNKPQAELISSGDNLKKFVLASMSIAYIFKPIKINGITYIDGDNSNHVPAQDIRKKVDILIGVDVMPIYEKKSFDSVMDINTRLYYLDANRLGKAGRELCDFMIPVHECSNYKMLDFDKFKEIYQIGYDTTLRYIIEHPDLKKKCSRREKNKFKI